MTDVLAKAMDLMSQHPALVWVVLAVGVWLFVS